MGDEVKRAALMLALLVAACGGDDSQAAAVAVDAGELGRDVDAGAELVDGDAGAELVDVAADVDGAELVDVDTGAELVDVADVAPERPRDARSEETGPPPFQCKSIDGTGQCGPTSPWPWICCRASPCECCNKPNCGVGD